MKICKPFSSFSFSSSSSNQPPDNYGYDVFLSFRGEDTRKNFTDHLYYALTEAGIHTFRDDEEIRKGENLSIELLQAIRVSRISVIVLSKNYASSRWCLNELNLIRECHQNGQLVLPVFYDVSPSDVRNQRGTFEQAFVEHEKRYFLDEAKVLRWRQALQNIAGISGWNLECTADG